jgi:hypothetical protein
MPSNSHAVLVDDNLIMDGDAEWFRSISLSELSAVGADAAT